MQTNGYIHNSFNMLIFHKGNMELDEELKTFINLWLIAIFSICYCYLIPSRISHGVPRLLSLLPVTTLFFILPLPISTVHLAFPAFFFLIWLGNFKLLLFAFNRGPLSSTPPLPILPFIAIALLPINPKQPNNKLSDSVDPSHKPILLAVKAVILNVMLHFYKYKDNLPWDVVIIFYFIHMYIGLEFWFAIAAFLVKIFVGFGFIIEPQFNEPYLATSLQDFWGRRWNLMSSSILRASVYNPIRAMWTPILGRLRGQMLAIFVTFVVSGLMHELMYLYILRVRPTWEVTCFFLLHGVCTAVEVAVKKAVNGRFELHRMVSGPVTVAFVVATGGWLLIAQPLRNGVDAKVINEHSMILKLLGLKGL
ncbi:putative long-chain-alcohol O-fatty-acyltransferase [Helianthus annuus]|nr:putative long-chain-alcohol O-fatty-acyltransferase [Helianthus annuus]